MTFLGQEPWCFSLDQIARLTDWQVIEFYHATAVKKQNEPELPPSRSAEDNPDGEEIDPELVAKWAKHLFGGVRRIPGV